MHKKKLPNFRLKNKELTAAIERLEKSLTAANEQIDAKQAMNEGTSFSGKTD